MRKILICCAVVLCAASFAHASNVGVSVGVNIGGPPPVYVNPPIVIERPPVFLLPPRLGFYVAAGVGYDMFYLGNRYYLHHGNIWYSSPYYNGPWVTVHYGGVPYEIRRHPFKQIHYYRDYHYRKYYHDRGHYKYRHFQPQYRDHRGRGHDWDRDGRGGDGRGRGGRGGDGHGGGHR